MRPCVVEVFSIACKLVCKSERHRVALQVPGNVEEAHAVAQLVLQGLLFLYLLAVSEQLLKPTRLMSIFLYLASESFKIRLCSNYSRVHSRECRCLVVAVELLLGRTEEEEKIIELL